MTDLTWLTPRQREVALLMAQDLTARQIGARLGILAGTVRTHVEHIYEKLGVKGRAGVTRYLIREGMLTA